MSSERAVVGVETTVTASPWNWMLRYHIVFEACDLRSSMDQTWPPRLHFAFSTETRAILWINIVLNKSWYVSVRFSVSCSREPLLFILNFLCALSMCAPDVWSTQSRENSVTLPNIFVWLFVIFFFLIRAKQKNQTKLSCIAYIVNVQ